MSQSQIDKMESEKSKLSMRIMQLRNAEGAREAVDALKTGACGVVFVLPLARAKVALDDMAAAEISDVLSRMVERIASDKI